MFDSNIVLAFPGKDVIEKIKVHPVVLEPQYDLSLNHDKHPKNMIIEGDNLSVIRGISAGSIALKGQVDLIVIDPPYNTGNSDFRYEDDFKISAKEEEAFKSTLSKFVDSNDPKRHLKWMWFMYARLIQLKTLLKPSGVIAVCIDYNELFRLGMLLDTVFGEQNRLGIINWQRRYAPSNDSKHISPTTEYVLAYAKYESMAKTNLLPRTEKMDSKYGRPDNDPFPWRSSDPSAARMTQKDTYGIQNPFTGEIQYPPEGRSWTNKKSCMKQWLEAWGSEYSEEIDPLNPDRPKALLIKGSQKVARQKAEELRDSNPWPKLYFLKNGYGRPAMKRYNKDVQQGRTVGTFFDDEEIYGNAASNNKSVSWHHSVSGHTDGATKMLNSIMGTTHNFKTVKPVMLIEKIIQLWCPPTGLVLDSFAGSGTTGHAVLNLNAYDENSDRSFILIESGSGEDKYCNSLTAERLRRVITGNWKSGQQNGVKGGFTFYKTGENITKKDVMTANHASLMNIIFQADDAIGFDCRIDNPGGYVIGKTRKGNALALIWDEQSNSILSDDICHTIYDEVKKFGLALPVHIFAKSNDAFESDNYVFRQIPQAILAALEMEDLYEED
ncbi:MAG: site-specific DNA-methyltransferase [Geobacteraceae bacterium]|nr:site-specific DNA-methyltransferase [Geobacteraceae bacterium]